MNTKKFLVAAAIAVVITNASLAATTYAQGMTERTVGPNDSIQAAINAEQPGETIVIRPGSYKENLLITKDGLKLRGKGVRLEPPATLAPTACDAANKPAPADISITQNTLHNNAPVDVFWDGTGSNVKIVRNACKTSQPAGLC